MMQLSFKSQLRSAKERIIEGYATTDSWDRQGERLPLDIAVSAFEKFSKSPKICTLHGRSEFGGKVNSVGCGGVADFLGYTVSGNGIYISVKITDDAAWDKVLSGEYSGFSIGGFGKLNQNGEFAYFEIIEISLVGYPINGDCVFLKVKGDIMDEESKGLLKSMLDALNKLQASIDRMATVETTEDTAGAAVMGCKGCQKMQAAKGGVDENAELKAKISALESSIAEINMQLKAAAVVAAKGAAYDPSNEVSKIAAPRTKASQFSLAELKAMSPRELQKIEID